MEVSTFDSTFLNDALRERLTGIHAIMMGAYLAGVEASSASKGDERETFTNLFLSQVFPPVFRFGRGDVIDQHNQRSGQLDVIVEFPFFPSLQTVMTGPRLYLAEGVAAAIEVKSDISKQLAQLESTATKVKALTPRQGGCTGPLFVPEHYRVPLFLVSFHGWKRLDHPIRLINDGLVNGVLILEHGSCCGQAFRPSRIVAVENNPAASLWIFVCCLHECITRLSSMTARPVDYFRDGEPAP